MYTNVHVCVWCVSVCVDFARLRQAHGALGIIPQAPVFCVCACVGVCVCVCVYINICMCAPTARGFSERCQNGDEHACTQADGCITSAANATLNQRLTENAKGGECGAGEEGGGGGDK